MRKASTPPKKSNPLVVAGGGVVLLGLVWFATGGGSDAPTGTGKKTTKRPAAKADGPYTEADRAARFPPLTLAVADAFTPLVKKPKPVVVRPPSAGIGGIDPILTGGDPNWYYTGWVELDGRRQALLENPTTGETEYVGPGEGWKKARVATIDVSVVVLIGPDGKDYRVPIQEYGVVPGQAPTPVAADPTARPLTLPAGVIGGPTGVPGGLAVRPAAAPTSGTATMTLPDGRTIQVPLDASAATDPSAGGNARRRNRRNRNNDSGGFNNAP